MRYRMLLVVPMALYQVAVFSQPKATTAETSAQKAPPQKQAAAGNDAKAVQLLQAIEQKHGQLRTVSGTFNQERQDTTFKDEKAVAVQAQFAMLKPNNFRVDYQGKAPSTTLITGQTYYNHTPALKQVQRYRFKNQASVRDVTYLLLGFGAKTDELLKVYTVKQADGGRLGVKLIPRNSKEASFNYITMELTDDLLPKRFGMEQNDGTKISVSLDVARLSLNQPLNDRIFQPDFKGAEMVDMQ